MGSDPERSEIVENSNTIGFKGEGNCQKFRLFNLGGKSGRMAREPRIHVENGIYHVILRGVDGQDIFFGDEYRSKFCELLGDGVSRYGHRIHVYCLMSNHVHLAIQVMDIPLSRIMHNVEFRYAAWFNHRRDRKGHLFQGRFKAILVKDDAQLLSLVRYIHLNPVRAHMTTSPSEFLWSSHRAYVNGTNAPSWLTRDLILKMFGREPVEARRKFADFVMAGIECESDYCLDDGEEWVSLGAEISGSGGPKTHSKGLKEGTLLELDELICQFWDLPAGTLSLPGQTRAVAEARGALRWLAREYEIASVHVVAKHLNRSVSSLRGIARRFEERLNDPKAARVLTKRLHRMVELLTSEPKTERKR